MVGFVLVSSYFSCFRCFAAFLGEGGEGGEAFLLFWFGFHSFQCCNAMESTAREPRNKATASEDLLKFKSQRNRGQGGRKKLLTLRTVANT